MKKEPLKPFVVDEGRVNALEILLKANSECITSKEKNSIIQAFRINQYAAFIELYTKKTEKRTEFVKKLEEFFFVGETYFDSQPKDAKIFGVIVLSRFRNLRDIGIESAIGCKGQFDKIPDVSWVLFGTPYKREDPSEEGEEELETILEEYQHLIIDGYFKEDVEKAFISRKPVTSIKVTNLEPKIVDQLIEDLGRFFIIWYGYSHLDISEFFVSHYENLPKILSDYSKNNRGVYDRFADLAGAFLLDVREYPPLKVASYCSRSDLKKLNFIK